MYAFHRKQADPLYSDYVIYSPGVPVFRDDSGGLNYTAESKTPPQKESGRRRGRYRPPNGSAMRISKLQPSYVSNMEVNSSNGISSPSMTTHS